MLKAAGVEPDFASGGRAPERRGARVTPVHAAVPGRARLRVAGLRRSPATKSLLEEELLLGVGVIAVSASIATGNALVLFDAALDLAEIIARVEALLDEGGAGGRNTVPPPEAPAGMSETAGRPEPPPESSAAEASSAPEPSSAPATEAPSSSWHAANADDVLAMLGASRTDGLAEEEARERLRRCGLNLLEPQKQRSGLAIFVDQFNSFPIAVLAGSAVLSLATGGVLDAIFIMSVVFINAGVGYVTESQTERIINTLGSAAKSPALVVRDGREREIGPEQVVPGDLLVLTSGAFVAADARLVETGDLAINEAALTGESLPIEKHTERLSESSLPLAERRNMVYKGTAVAGGRGVAVVVATGPDTEIGRVQALVHEAVAPQTPMQRQLDAMGRRLVWLTGGACAAVAGFGLFHGAPLLQMFKTATALAVAAIPEGLPTVAITTLALGAREMQKRNVLMRRLDAVETLGSVQAMCFDKTGTLTLNTMSVAAVHVDGATCDVEHGRFRRNGAVVAPLSDPAFARLLEVGVLCNECEIQRDGEGWRIEGSATERALIELALQAGVDPAALRERRPAMAMRRRSQTRMYMSTAHSGEGGRTLLAVKGNPLDVLALCRFRLDGGAIRPLDAEGRKQAETANDRMARSGWRVLGFAFAESQDAGRNASPDASPEANAGLVWLGLAGMADPLRPRMRALLASFRQAGVRTMMVTGDQGSTAYAIARRLDISGGGEIRVLEASSLDQVSPEMLAALVPQADVFARISPAHKLRIVQALQKNGMVVAMTGDGVNDGPALKAADIGVAMGKAGTDVAREVADVVLMDDDLHGMAAAVGQGRTLYGNVRKAIRYILATNASETFTVLAATAANAGEVLTPMQLLWINLISEICPALALTLEAPDADVMKRPPRAPDEPIVAARDVPRLGFEAGVITAGSLAAYGYGLSRFGMGPQASSMAFHSIVTAQLLHAISARSATRSIFSRDKRPPNRFLDWALAGSFAAQALAATLPPLRALLGVAPLGPGGVAVALAGGVIPFLINEATKPGASAGPQASPRPSRGPSGDAS